MSKHSLLPSSRVCQVNVSFELEESSVSSCKLTGFPVFQPKEPESKLELSR